MRKLLLMFVVVLMSFPVMVMAQCGTNLTATDQDGAIYQSVKIGPHCWIQTNLKTKASGSMIYRSDMYPDTVANLATFGRLYPWSVAAVFPMEVGEHNFVQGICPEGWHLPLQVEVRQLSTYRSSDVRSAEQWLIPGNNTTNFSLLPGGFYNNGTVRCENLGGEAYFWSVGAAGEPVEVWSDCHCNIIRLNPGKVNNALSVRCVYKIYQAQVATETATDIKAYQANLNGDVVFAGYDQDFIRGFVYGTHRNDLSKDTAQLHQTAEGQYSFKIENLEPNTTYYYKAYVVNEFDTVYGAMKIFTTLPIDTIAFVPNGGMGTMDSIFVTRGEQATLPANGFTHEGNWEFVVWNTEFDGSGTNYAVNQQITITGNLTLYANWHTYCTGTANNTSEKAAVAGRIDTLQDADGNKYQVVQIGNQCWMRENMRAKHEPGSDVDISNNINLSRENDPMAFKVSPNHFEKYGYLYNFQAAVNTTGSNLSFEYPRQGICPEGWHIPTNVEWSALASYAGVGVNGGVGAGKIAGGFDWISTDVATAPGNYSYTKRDSTGFSALPAGGVSLGFDNEDTLSIFWSSTLDEENNAYCFALEYDADSVVTVPAYRFLGFSVRCLRDAEEVPVITDTIAFVPNGGMGTMDSIFVTRGEQATLPANGFTHEGNWEFTGWNDACDGTGNIYTVAENIITNGNLTLYAQWHTWCAGTPQNNELGTSRIDSVKDVNNNKYAVVQIGNQCWLKENMRATTEPSGTNTIEINAGELSENSPMAYSNSNEYLMKYGYLYNYSAAMNVTDDANSYEYPHQGICPQGWHIPTDEEWNALIVSAGVDRENGDVGVGKLTGGCDWEETAEKPYSPGNYSYSKRDYSGFSILPAGLNMEGEIDFAGFGAAFWSSTSHAHDEGPLYWAILNSNIEESGYVQNSNNERSVGLSVRCLRDADA